MTGARLAVPDGDRADAPHGALRRGHTGRMDTKDTLLRYLAATREALLWKAEGLTERELRMPHTPTGTNLLGLIKHCASLEHGYLVSCLGLTSDVAMPEFDFQADPNGDFFATAEESAVGIIDLYRQVGAAVEEALSGLDLDAPAHVPWWGDRGDTTLGRLLVHVLTDVSRHAGHADIVREGIDGAAGLNAANSNLWEPEGGWAGYVAKLTRLADEAR